jgi:hypothetical protein
MPKTKTTAHRRRKQARRRLLNKRGNSGTKSKHYLTNKRIVKEVLENRASKKRCLEIIDKCKILRHACPLYATYSSDEEGGKKPKTVYRDPIKSATISFAPVKYRSMNAPSHFNSTEPFDIEFCSVCGLSIPYRWTLPTSVTTSCALMFYNESDHTCICHTCLNSQYLQFPHDELEEFDSLFCTPLIETNKAHPGNLHSSPWGRTISFSLFGGNVCGKAYLTLGTVLTGYDDEPFFSHIYIQITRISRNMNKFEKFLHLLALFSQRKYDKIIYLSLAMATYPNEAINSLNCYGFSQSDITGDEMLFFRSPLYTTTQENESSRMSQSDDDTRDTALENV